MSPRTILVAVAWPYVNGSLHLGQVAGAYLPPDIFARFQRMRGHRVLMVSGSDVHGTPTTVRAEQEGVTPQDIVDRFHPEFLRNWEELGIQFDLFTTTGTGNHAAVSQDVFLKLLEHGYLEKRATDQMFDPDAERFLPDRYIEGTCPHCGYGEARGDQCDNCGRTLDPPELIEPRSKLSGATPVLRSTEHYFLLLTKLAGPLLEWLQSRQGWRKHVRNFSVGFVEEGLLDRAITRDIDWGVPLPVDDLGPGKSIYVWFEAVIGYLSAAKEWSQINGTPEAWRDWWEADDAESYYFIGKDNIIFHAVIWPAMLIGYGGLNLPTDVPANQYVTFKGSKASTSRGVGRSLPWYLERVEADALRYAIASHLPEQADTDFSDEEMVRSINDELVATWGNLVNRVVSMTHSYFGGKIPAGGDADDEDRALLSGVDGALDAVAAAIDRVQLKQGLAEAMAAAGAVNSYLSSRAPWKTAAGDLERTGTTLRTAAEATAAVNVALSPYLPFSAAKVRSMFGLTPEAVWERPQVVPNTEVGSAEPLYRKLDQIE